MSEASLRLGLVPPFRIESEFAPEGDQPAAIDQLTAAVQAGEEHITLLGATGTGKTFTIAHVIERVQRPTIVMAPNKSLAAQLANEFRGFFPDNAVEYFVSYYDYYQPEAYVPQTDTYIEKDSSVNEEIERLRHSATAALLSRNDVIIVASVSAIYGLGSPEEYEGQLLRVYRGTEVPMEFAMQRLVDIQYQRNQVSRARGTFRVTGDTLEVFPPYEQAGYRIEWWGDEVQKISMFDPLTGEIVKDDIVDHTTFPASHYVASDDRMKQAIVTIEEELHERLAYLDSQGKLLEAERLRMRTTYDLEMLREMGFCSGIENYSRHIDGREAGTAPFTLLDYFPDDYLVVLDESHVTVPQLRGMYEGDVSRKTTLVDFGFRLPSAIDNRPLRFEEFRGRVGQVVYMSATPGPYELQHSTSIVEQIVRPTGLVDPEVQIRPTKGQIDDLIEEIRGRAESDQRVLVTTLTKKMAEDLTDYLVEMGIRVRYMHSEVDTDPADRDRPRPAPGGVRRAGRHQPAPGGARPARGVARRDPRRRQGGVPAVGNLPRTDDRAGGPQRRRHRADVRRQRHRLDARRDRRDPAPPADPAGLQRRARDRPADDPQAGDRHPALAPGRGGRGRDPRAAACSRRRRASPPRSSSG